MADKDILYEKAVDAAAEIFNNDEISDSEKIEAFEELIVYVRALIDLVQDLASGKTSD